MLKDVRIGVIGLGYVGLPLAVEFAKHFPVCGFDIDKERIDQLNQGIDRTLEVSKSELNAALEGSLTLHHQVKELSLVNVYIVTVPTPIDKQNLPNLNPLKMATESIASVLKKGDVVIYESTTYPGCTEEVCVPILEVHSGLIFNDDFFCGYSPERINPGDKTRSIADIVKVTSGSTPQVAEFVDQLYRQIVKAGTHKASSIQVAEAAKAIENAQRDLNISFVNELALLFHKLGIDTQEVLEAAKTKWNFLPFKPGLVGGHCIGVDPYYLVHRAQEKGYQPNVILSGRSINDKMGEFVAHRVLNLLSQRGIKAQQAKIDVLGLAFKANCPDTRNSKVFDVIATLAQHGCSLSIWDPWVQDAPIVLNSKLREDADLVLLAVAHNEFVSLDWKQINARSLVFDVTGTVPKFCTNDRL